MEDIDENVEEKSIEQQKDEFRIMVEKTKQGEKNLYTPLSRKWGALIQVSVDLLVFTQSEPIDSKRKSQMKNEKESELKNGKEKNKAKGSKVSVSEEKEGPTAFDLAKSFF